MNREQILLTVKLYTSLAAAGICASLQSLFTWISNRCDDANTFFTAKSAQYRR